MFDPMWKLALGLATGIVFGFLLQKGRVAKYEVIVGQFLLRDWTVVKVTATAGVVGMVGVYALFQFELASLHVKPLLVGGLIARGVLFGIGIVLLGSCPGTTVAACGEGRRDAMVGLLGMLAGAWLECPQLRPAQAAADGAGRLPQADGSRGDRHVPLPLDRAGDCRTSRGTVALARPPVSASARRRPNTRGIATIAGALAVKLANPCQQGAADGISL